MSNRYFKRNYDEIVDILTPAIYKERDIELSGMQYNPIDRVMTGIIHLINACTDVKVVSRRPFNFSGEGLTDINFNMDDFSGLAAQFVEQNNLPEVNPRDFDLKILNKLGKSLSDFNTEEEFKNFMSGTFLPTIPAYGLTSRRPIVSVDLADTTASAFATTHQGTHDYLSDALGWFYYLNQPQGYPTLDFYDPSSFLLDAYTEKLFKGQTLKLKDAVEVMFNYLWYDQDGRSVTGTYFAGSPIYGEALYGYFIDPSYSSGTDIWTSGNQQLDNYKVLLDVLFQEKPTSKQDTYIKDSLQEYIDSGITPESENRAAPFSRFMKAVSFMMADINEYNEKLRSVKSIDDCPAELLPYLADLIGWRFYNNDIRSWRRQLRNAVDLYKKKGTKEGLIALINSVLPGNGINFQESISEFYESYIPQMMFYLLATASPQFNNLETWTHKKSLEFNEGEYDPTNLEENIRYTVDHILLRAVRRFPDLFSIRGYKFNIYDTSFRFNYRNREFRIPPWEEEKFYTDCDINEDLIDYFSEELKCLGVSAQYVDTFKDFILSNTVSGDQPIKKYNTTYLFFTDNLISPPNHDVIINSFDKRRLKYLPLWNAKSSHFDFTVSGAGFDLEFFQSPNYNRYDFTNSLASVADFTPSKAIARVHVDISGVDQVSTGDYFFPKVKYSLVDLQPPSGAAASWQASGLDMRNPNLGLRGADIHRPPFFVEDLSKTHINHAALPCFTRNQTLFGVAPITTNPLTASGPYTAEAPRTAVRRRNNEKSITKGEWYSRTGYNQPTFYNGASSTVYDPNVSEDTLYDFLPLGWTPSSYSFTPVTLPVSGVWDRCETVDSSSIYNGVETSACYEIRGSVNYTATSSIKKDEEHFYVDRSNLSEVIILIKQLLDEKIKAKAAEIYNSNRSLFDASASYLNIVDSLANYMINNGEDSISDYFDFEFGTTKPKCKGLFIGMHRLYDAYVKSLGFHSVSDSELNSLDDGGLSVISHAYGPLAYNAKLTVNGEEYDSNYNKKSGSVSDEFVFSTSAASLTAFYEADTVKDLYAGRTPERRCFGLLSGVEVVDTSTSPNVMSCFNLSSDRSILGGPVDLVGKNIIAMKSLRGLPRLRYHIGSDNGSGRAYGPRVNKLVPEHDFDFQVSSQFLEEFSNVKGGGSVGIWIHTIPELDANGDYVFWNYMPNGKWEMHKATDVASNNYGMTKIKNELSHLVDIRESSIIRDLVPCYESGEPSKLSLLSVGANDFNIGSIRFNTQNRLIKVPVEYYQKYQQVHRLDQSYAVEIFPLPSNEGFRDSDTKKYWICKGMQIVDRYFNSCTNTIEHVDIPSFAPAFSPTVSSIVFYREDGSIVPQDTLMYVDEDGNITLDGEKITYGFTSPVVQSPEKPKLYSKVYAYTKSSWVSESLLVDSEETTNFFIDNVKYVGEFTQDSDYILSPYTLGMVGSELGSHIVKPATIYYKVSPENILRAFRHFRYVSEQISSRDNSETEDLYGLSGGGRLNYRIHPASYQNDNTWQTSKRYNELEFYN